MKKDDFTFRTVIGSVMLAFGFVVPASAQSDAPDVERVVVEDIQLLRHPAIAKLGIEVVACGEPRPDATIATVARKTRIIPDGTTRLSRLVVTAKGRPCRHANKTVGPNVVLHHHIGHARRPQASHSATFKYQSSFLSIHNSANI